jgi:hypothetical protein
MEFSAFALESLEMISDLSGHLRQQIMQAFKDRKPPVFLLEHGLPGQIRKLSEILFNLERLRPKPKMILFLAFQVKTKCCFKK